MIVTVVIYSNPFFQSSASANRWLTLIEGLCATGVKVYLLICGGYMTANEQTKFGVKGIYKNISYEYVLPILLQGYWKVRFYNYFGQTFRNSKVINELLKRFKNDSDIIWTDSTQLSFQFTFALKKQKTRAKCFVEMSEFLDIHMFNRGNYLQRMQGDFRQSLFEKNAYFYYDGMALMTKTLINHYQSFPKPQPKILHLPMTVDLDRFSGKHDFLNEFKHPYITFIGVMNDAKDGVSLLIKSFNLLKHKYKNYKLYLVGPWNYDTPNHLKLIEELELQNQVFWMKEYPRDEIPKIVCNADLLVLPRPDSKQAQGGFPTKLGEYLASGKPVCATRVGEIPDYLEDNDSVFFAEPGSVESFAEAMDRALGDPQNAQRVGLNGRRVAEREFNKDIQAKKLYDFIKQL